MSEIEQGTRVRVIVEGEVLFRAGAFLRVDTPDMYYTFYPRDPAVQVVPIDPDRPSLDRETIARVLHQSDWPGVDWNEESSGGQGCYRNNADAVLALIDTAQRGLIR